MPTPKQTLRFRGKQRILLRRVIKVVKEVLDNDAKYPGGETGDRNFILDAETLVNLGLASQLATAQLTQKWPILIPPP